MSSQKPAVVRQLRGQFNNSRLLRYLLLLALGWGIAQILAYFETVIIVFSFAAILAFLLSHPVRWIQRYLPHGLAVMLVFLAFIICLGGLTFVVGAVLLSQGQQLLEQLPDILNYLASLIDGLQSLLERFRFEIDLSGLEDQLRDQAIAGLGVGLTTAQRILMVLVELILVAVVGFFMLLDGGRLWHFLLQVLPGSLRPRLTEAIQQNLLGFFWGRFLLSLFFGLSCLVVFILLDIPFALLLAAIAGVFDLIPGIGATLGVCLVALILLPQGLGLSAAVIVICVLLQQIEENLLMPRIMQGSINMNPVVMFFALLMGAQIAGFLGLFLSIPVAGVIISLLNIEAMKGGQPKPE
ncbi:AI-2E family transporter [Synechococcales cyanobacterium C]|uniref:AI-2E family transporter n=1 Tax=Petrachloros mirabilis ULC683 TaxID=2781853 RepID=A0A8K1ZXY6_9CYAN|nr:AI-2E family transporter [Petrachloros mirabilis]NCJ07229.1 AI-2E family transporter [Petrachloros mirabilis ULC683]